MEFAANKIFIELDNETEEIYSDEVTDGVANAAEEQCQVWALEAKEQKSDSKFVEELLKLAVKLAGKRVGESRSGAMGTQTRVQPAHQKGKKAVFDK